MHMMAPPQTTTLQTFPITGSEKEHNAKGCNFYNPEQGWNRTRIFTITDKDGNIAQEQFVLTVQ